MAKIAKQLTELIGHTPLLELTNYEKALGLEAKIIAGFVRNPVVPFIIGVLILIGTFVGIKYIIKYITRTDKANEQAE